MTFFDEELDLVGRQGRGVDPRGAFPEHDLLVARRVLVKLGEGDRDLEIFLGQILELRQRHAARHGDRRREHPHLVAGRDVGARDGDFECLFGVFLDGDDDGHVFRLEIHPRDGLEPQLARESLCRPLDHRIRRIDLVERIEERPRGVGLDPLGPDQDLARKLESRLELEVAVEAHGKFLLRPLPVGHVDLLRRDVQDPGRGEDLFFDERPQLVGADNDPPRVGARGHLDGERRPFPGDHVVQQGASLLADTDGQLGGGILLQRDVGGQVAILDRDLDVRLIFQLQALQQPEDESEENK